MSSLLQALVLVFAVQGVIFGVLSVRVSNLSIHAGHMARADQDGLRRQIESALSRPEVCQVLLQGVSPQAVGVTTGVLLWAPGQSGAPDKWLQAGTQVGSLQVQDLRVDVQACPSSSDPECAPPFDRKAFLTVNAQARSGSAQFFRTQLGPIYLSSLGIPQGCKYPFSGPGGASGGAWSCNWSHGCGDLKTLQRSLHMDTPVAYPAAFGTAPSELIPQLSWDFSHHYDRRTHGCTNGHVLLGLNQSSLSCQLAVGNGDGCKPNPLLGQPGSCFRVYPGCNIQDFSAPICPWGLELYEFYHLGQLRALECRAPLPAGQPAGWSPCDSPAWCNHINLPPPSATPAFGHQADGLTWHTGCSVGQPCFTGVAHTSCHWGCKLPAGKTQCLWP
jgi:hypothetical protein